MSYPLILASGSSVRAQMLAAADVQVEVIKPRVDEEPVKHALLAEKATPRDIADALAELKAQRVAMKHPGRMVLGSDQVLDLDGQLLSKPDSPQAAVEQLTSLRGKTHTLYSAAVIFDNGQPVWRAVGRVDLTMRMASDVYLNDYTQRNWHSIQHAVGAYKLEEEGVRLFTKINGDYFTVLGMPLLDVLDYLGTRGVVST